MFMIGRIWEILGDQFCKNKDSCFWTSWSIRSFRLNLRKEKDVKIIKQQFQCFTVRLTLKIVQAIAE